MKRMFAGAFGEATIPARVTLAVEPSGLSAYGGGSLDKVGGIEWERVVSVTVPYPSAISISTDVGEMHLSMQEPSLLVGAITMRPATSGPIVAEILKRAAVAESPSISGVTPIPAARRREHAGPMTTTTLQRPRSGRVIAGVCAGLANRFGWNANVVRLLFILSLLLPGPQLIVYLVMWIVIPQEPQVVVAPASTPGAASA